MREQRWDVSDVLSIDFKILFILYNKCLVPDNNK